MEIWQIILIVVASIALVLIVVAVQKYQSKVKKENIETKKKENEVEVVVKDGIRYSKDTSIIDENDQINITRNEKDFVLKQDQVYTTNRNSRLKPGTYTILSTDESVTEFGIRVGSYFRTMSHGDTLVLADGENVCATSHTLILR